MADLPSFQALWPDFQRYFTNAREEAAGLVLGKYRRGGDYYPCYNDSGPEQTVAKLAFLKQQGVTAPVTGLRSKALEDAKDPVLTAMATNLAPRTPAEPRLVQAPLHCKPVLDEMLLDGLVSAPTEDSNIPADQVQAIAVPGNDQCGWVIGADAYADDLADSDDFFYGPGREGSTRCADLPDELSVWVRGADGFHSLDREPLRDGSSLTTVRDQATSKQYLLTDGKRGSRCSVSYGLPDAYEWRVGPDGPGLQPSRDGFLLRRLLRAQCEETDPSDPSAGVACRGMPSQETPDDTLSVADALQEGRVLSIDRVVDWLGSARRQDYAKAIAGHDHAALGRLLAHGLPPRWTADEIRAVGKSSLPLEERRRRIALLFANPEQLARALFAARYDLPEMLLPWLPDQDWGPVLRVIERSPDFWRGPASHLREAVVTAGRPGLACAIDHAQGFVCGGGIVLD